MTKLFISATTADLATARACAKRGLETVNYTVDEQDTFEADAPQSGCIVVYAGQVRAIIHCSSDNFKKTGDAIGENLDTKWQKALPKSRYGWFVALP